MDKHTLSGIAVPCLYLALGNVRFLEAQVPVELIGVPAAADSVFVLADSDDLSSPLEAFARLQQSTSLLRLTLPPPKSQSLRIRAVAFGGESMFPTVTAIGTATYRTTQSAPASIVLTWPTPLIEKLNEDASGSTRFLVTFSGTDFYRTGDAAELWVSGSSWSRNCTGAHFLAPLLKTDAGWQAFFIIPTRLCTGTTLQVAYHAVAFKVFNQTPIFVWPNRERNEDPLQLFSHSAPSSGTQRLSAPQQSDDNTRQADTIDRSFSVVTTKNGRLIRVPAKAVKNKSN